MSKVVWCWLVVALLCLGCDQDSAELDSGRTFAELRTVKGDVRVSTKGTVRKPYGRDRLVVGDVVKIPAGGLTWMRRDGGATWLVAGPANVTLERGTVKLDGGRVFIDTEQGEPVTIATPKGPVELSGARASVEVTEKNVTAYVLRGSARAAGGTRAAAGEMLTLAGEKASKKAVVSWEDWTGGLGTADPTAAPAPFGIGTVGARSPGAKGKPRASLVIQRLQVNVTIEKDIAFTEVDQTFVNPTSQTVEGIFKFRTPLDATLSQFAVDRDGKLVWGRVKESKSAQATYESHVYQGSTEDPALLSWESPGVYSARLYPIHAGAERRVVTRYSQWLSRQGETGERRLYVYPMAAEGAKSSLPRIEEMTVKIDVSQAGAESVRAGMGGIRKGDTIIVKAFDFTPQADLAVELFDNGRDKLVGYRSPHALGEDEIPEGKDEEFAKEVEKTESDYVAVPLRVPPIKQQSKGMDLAVVVDTSAATEPAALAISRSLASALLAHLGPEDRAALFAGDSNLRPVIAGSDKYSELTPARRKKWLSGLSSVERGGATDLGSLVTEAATSLDPKRASAVIYIGDGAPSVGEIAPKDLRDRLARLPAGTRIIPVAVGSQPNVTLLDQISRGAPMEVVEDAYGAARAALRILEAVGRPTWMGATVDLGPGVERVLPNVLPPLAANETVMIIGRRTGKLPSEILLKGTGGESRMKIAFDRLEDRGDLRRRWGTIRLASLMDEGAGRSTLVDLSERYGLVSPFTSLYVPTRAEEEEEDYVDEVPTYEKRRAKLLRWKPWAQDGGMDMEKTSAPAYADAEAPLEERSVEEDAIDREGGTGTRAKGEDGSMGAPTTAGKNKRYAVRGPKEDAAPAPARQQALRDAKQFGMIGNLKPGAAAEPPPPPAVEEAEEARPEPRMLEAKKSVSRLRRARPASPRPTCAPGDPMCAGLADQPADGSLRGEEVGEAFGAGGLGLKGSGRGGGASGEGLGAQLAAASDQSTEDIPSPVSAASARTKTMGYVGHVPVPCGMGADLPLLERRVLWRERLAGQGVSRSVQVYQNALRDCEATNWRERVALLVLMVDQLPNIPDRVSLYRTLLRISPGAADAVYRFLVLRVRTADELRQLHLALGFKQAPHEELEKIREREKDPRMRLTLLRKEAEDYPDDSELALRVLEAYEDADDEAGGRAWARKLRKRVDATSHLRTSVGEYYLRLGKKQGKAGARDEAEGLRTFGEIVEFAPEDPLARRHLGDLLSAHGHHAQALRQYETLARLTPDDPTVQLLLARAAQGTGKTERAVRLAEQAASTSAPDSSQPVSVAARALSAVFLADARIDAQKGKRKDELARLRGRAGRLAADKAGSGHRVVVSWSHPELRPVLWTNALGAMMPSADNLPMLRVAEAYVPSTPAPQIEVRLDPEDAKHAARLGLHARVTVLVSEGQDDEKILNQKVVFRDSDGKPREKVRLTLDGAALKEVNP